MASQLIPVLRSGDRNAVSDLGAIGATEFLTDWLPATECADAGGGPIGWVGGEGGALDGIEVFADDGDYAATDLAAGATGPFLLCFDLNGVSGAVEADATIEDVDFRLRLKTAYAGFISVTNVIAKLVVEGSVVGNDLGGDITYGASETLVSIEDVLGTAGVALTAAQVRASDFGIAFAIVCSAGGTLPGSLEFLIDQVEMRIKGTTPGITDLSAFFLVDEEDQALLDHNSEELLDDGAP